MNKKHHEPLNEKAAPVQVMIEIMIELARYACMYMNLSVHVSLACLKMQCWFVGRRQSIFDVAHGRCRFGESALC